MKKTTLLTIFSLTALLLSACGAAGSGSSSSTGGFRNSSALRSRPLTPEAKLALGTIKLEGTPQAVDPEEAARLLPLWQLLAQLLGTSSSAPQEITAVIDQIQAGMTPEQVRAIKGMQLNSTDIFAAFQQQAQGSSSSSTDGSSSASGTNRAAGGNRGGGFFIAGPGGGGFPGGGFGANRSGASTNGSTSAASAAQAAQQASNQISLAVVNQLVRLLETRING